MDDIAIKVDKVSKSFKLPHERHGSIKSAFVNVFRRKRTFEKQQALKDISFEIKKGEFFGIVGRNGSGKSTLLKLLAEIYSPDNGQLQINGKLTPFIELGVGFNFDLTGRENVFLNGALLGFSRKEMDGMYDEIVEFAELERFMDQKLKNYSSGMQVRLAFSIAIRAKTDILLLDEVLAVGDAAFQQKCFDYFEELKKRKTTVVFVTHDMGSVMRFCTKAVYIKDSKIIYEGSPFEVADMYAEENLKSIQKAAQKAAQINDIKLSNKHKFILKIVEQSDSKVVLGFTYQSQVIDDMSIGISVFKDGLSIAEITTAPDRPLLGDGEVFYILDTSILNGGTYQVGAVLFKTKTRETLRLHKKETSFIVKGRDLTKGAAIKLANTWQYEKN